MAWSAQVASRRPFLAKTHSTLSLGIIFSVVINERLCVQSLTGLTPTTVTSLTAVDGQWVHGDSPLPTVLWEQWVKLWSSVWDVIISSYFSI